MKLPAPEDDGAADHLPGSRLPALRLPASDGRSLSLSELPTRSVVFVHPGIGGHRGRNARLEEWTAIPGARGCTAEVCGVRDEVSAFEPLAAGLFGLSSETSAEQRSHADRLGLPYPLLSDASLQLADALGLPTFEFEGTRYYRRLTLVVSDASIEAAVYPVFPPERAAAQALRWLREHVPPEGSPEQIT